MYTHVCCYIDFWPSDLHVRTVTRRIARSSVLQHCCHTLQRIHSVHLGETSTWEHIAVH